MGASLGAGIIFLVDILFEIAKFFMVVRLLMEFARVDFFNPFAHGIARITSPIIKPFSFIPHIGHFNLACFLIYIFFHTGQLALKFLVLQSKIPAFVGLFIMGTANAIHGIIVLWMIIIFIRVILSWIPFLGTHPLVFVIARMANPVLHPFARLLPNTGGIDFSPILALVALKFFDIVVAGGLSSTGYSLL